MSNLGTLREAVEKLRIGESLVYDASPDDLKAELDEFLALPRREGQVAEAFRRAHASAPERGTVVKVVDLNGVYDTMTAIPYGRKRSPDEREILEGRVMGKVHPDTGMPIDRLLTSSPLHERDNAQLFVTAETEGTNQRFIAPYTLFSKTTDQ